MPRNGSKITRHAKKEENITHVQKLKTHCYWEKNVFNQARWPDIFNIFKIINKNIYTMKEHMVIPTQKLDTMKKEPKRDLEMKHTTNRRGLTANWR